jgi:hypothetical protein
MRDFFTGAEIKSVAKIRTVVRLMLRRDSAQYELELEPKLRAFNRQLSGKHFTKIINRLKNADHGSELRDHPVITPWHPQEKANEVLLDSGTSNVLLSLYDSALAAAIKAKNAKLAAWLGIKCGQVAMDIAFGELVWRGHSVTVGGRKRILTKKKEKAESADRLFGSYVCERAHAYEIKQAAIQARATLKGFRKFLRDDSKSLVASDDKALKAIGKRLLGRAGTESDGFMSEKQITRIIKTFSRKNNITQPSFIR